MIQNSNGPVFELDPALAPDPFDYLEPAAARAIGVFAIVQPDQAVEFRHPLGALVAVAEFGLGGDSPDAGDVSGDGLLGVQASQVDQLFFPERKPRSGPCGGVHLISSFMYSHVPAMGPESLLSHFAHRS